MRISENGFVSQSPYKFFYDAPDNPQRNAAGIYQGRIIDHPDEDLYLVCPYKGGPFDLRKCAWGQSFFNPDEGSFILPRPWIYDRQGNVSQSGDLLAVMFFRDSTENPFILSAIMPYIVDDFFDSPFKKGTDREKSFPLKEAYHSDYIRWKRKNTDREITIQEDGDGIVNIQVTGDKTLNVNLGENTTLKVSDATLELIINGSLILKVVDGEVNAGGDATEHMILGESLLQYINSTVIAAVNAQTHPVTGAAAPALDGHTHTVTGTANAMPSPIAQASIALLATQGKVK